MSGMTTTDTAYRWGHLSTEHLHPWAELVNLLAEVDQTDEFLGPEDLAEELGGHGVDPAHDSSAVWDSAALAAHAQVRVSHTLDGEGRVRIWASGGVHPEHRGRGLGRRLLQESEQRGLELAGDRHPGAPAFWRADGGLEGDPVRPMLEHCGYAVIPRPLGLGADRAGVLARPLGLPQRPDGGVQPRAGPRGPTVGLRPVRGVGRPGALRQHRRHRAVRTRPRACPGLPGAHQRGSPTTGCTTGWLRGSGRAGCSWRATRRTCTHPSAVRG